MEPCLRSGRYSNAIGVAVADDSVDPLEIRTNYVFSSET